MQNQRTLKIKYTTLPLKIENRINILFFFIKLKKNNYFFLNKCGKCVIAFFDKTPLQERKQCSQEDKCDLPAAAMRSTRRFIPLFRVCFLRNFLRSSQRF